MINSYRSIRERKTQLEDMVLKKKKYSVIVCLLMAAMLTSCGADPAITQFKKDMDDFCETVAELNESINKIDAGADNAPALALRYLDQLDEAFQDFADMDFPKDYDYLESVADEAGEYMSEAVRSYHVAYADDGYDEATAAYARENSARAFKRVQVILDILHGKTPETSSSASAAND